MLDSYKENNPLSATMEIKTEVKYVKKIKESVSSMNGVENIYSKEDINPYILFFLKIWTSIFKY